MLTPDEAERLVRDKFIDLGLVKSEARDELQAAVALLYVSGWCLGVWFGRLLEREGLRE